MAKFDPKAIWSDVKAYRRVYFLTAVASFGGMLFGWDTGLIGMRQASFTSYWHR
jgi:SP family sugar:H+ symporter-like MFS transporter